jgi:hypothetical protein
MDGCFLEEVSHHFLLCFFSAHYITTVLQQLYLFSARTRHSALVVVSESIPIRFGSAIEVLLEPPPRRLPGIDWPYYAQWDRETGNVIVS